MVRTFPTLAIGLPRFSLREPDGMAEFAIGRGAAAALPRPQRVTHVLIAAIKTIEGQDASADFVRRLSSGTREWLLQKVAALFRPRDDWFEGTCTVCGSQYDIALNIGDLPTKPAGLHFPVVDVATSLGRRRFDVPNGTDEEAVPLQKHGADPRRSLAALCGLADDAEKEAALFTDDDLDRIDTALDEASPQPSDRSATRCPSCGHATEAAIEPLDFAFPTEMALLKEIHQLAQQYHWSEEAILSLPTRRRRQYLAIIRSERRSVQPGRRG